MISIESQIKNKTMLVDTTFMEKYMEIQVLLDVINQMPTRRERQDLISKLDERLKETYET